MSSHRLAREDDTVPVGELPPVPTDTPVYLETIKATGINPKRNGRTPPPSKGNS